MHRYERAAPARKGRREPRLAELGAVYAFALPGGLFGACQAVAEAEPGQVEIVALDWLAPERPSPQRAAVLEPLRPTFGNWNGEPARCVVDERVPWWAERVVVLRPPRFAEPCGAVGDWEVALRAWHRHLWETGARRAWRHDPSPVAIDLGGGPVEVRRDCARAEIGPGGTFRAPSTGRVRFDALDALPCLTEIAYAGADPGLVAYVVDRKLPKIAWRAHGQGVIDLRGARLEELTVDAGEGDLTLVAPETLRRLTIEGDARRVSLEGAHVGFPFLLRIEGRSLSPPPRGAEAIRRVEYAGVHDGDWAALAAYTDLAELDVYGAPGRLRGGRALASLSGLRELRLRDLYDLDAAAWPREWPALEGARVQGLRKADAPALRRSLATVPDVRISGARTDGWIAANLDCPFRDWTDDDPAFGRAACAAWRKASGAARTRGVLATRPDAERILKGLVQALNRLDRKHGIDTHRREQAGGAFFGLAAELGVPGEQAAAWFDGWRSF